MKNVEICENHIKQFSSQNVKDNNSDIKFEKNDMFSFPLDLFDLFVIYNNKVGKLTIKIILKRNSIVISLKNAKGN